MVGRLAALIAAALALAACGGKPIDHGRIADKQFVPAHTDYIYCGQGCLMPDHTGDRWYLFVSLGQRHRKVRVDVGDYQRAEIGGTWREKP